MVILIVGHPLVFGLDPEEVVVHEDCCYLKDGKEIRVASAMAQTSYGLKVKVL